MYRPQSREEFRRQQEQRKRIRADLRALSRVTTLIIFGGIIARMYRGPAWLLRAPYVPL